jgi:hypothetical protein
LTGAINHSDCAAVIAAVVDMSNHLSRVIMNANNDSHAAVIGFSLVNLAPLGNFTICTTSFCRSASSFCRSSDTTSSKTELFVFCTTAS